MGSLPSILFSNYARAESAGSVMHAEKRSESGEEIMAAMGLHIWRFPYNGRRKFLNFALAATVTIDHALHLCRANRNYPAQDSPRFEEKSASPLRMSLGMPRSSHQPVLDAPGTCDAAYHPL
jgi:hypothetical protein